jgi:hypothetical protein
MPNPPASVSGAFISNAAEINCTIGGIGGSARHPTYEFSV